MVPYKEKNTNRNKFFVDAKLYNRDYYLTDCDGYEDYTKGRLNLKRHQRVINFAELSGSEKILDVGCGRGELSYQCALRGCKVVAIDYSEDAIILTKETVSKLPNKLQENIDVKLMDVVNINLKDKFDVIFMVDLVEHLYDWQLEILFNKTKDLLKTNGRMIIQTPNLNYERFLFPLKRIISLPATFIKQFLRVLRGKRREKTWKEWFKKTFRIFLSKERATGAISLRHVNTQAPKQLYKLLHNNFNTKIFCVDHSKNPISLVFKKWWGREIVVIATLK